MDERRCHDGFDARCHEFSCLEFSVEKTRSELLMLGIASSSRARRAFYTNNIDKGYCGILYVGPRSKIHNPCAAPRARQTGQHICTTSQRLRAAAFNVLYPETPRFHFYVAPSTSLSLLGNRCCSHGAYRSQSSVS